MATAYNTIIDRFIPTISEYAFFSLDENEREEFIDPYIISAATEFDSVCIEDLADRDEELRQFNIDLSDEVIEILVDLMRVGWLKHKLYNSEKLKNGMSTKDYTVFSPANLLSEIRDTYVDARDTAKNRLVMYTYTHNRDRIAGLTKNGS